MFIKNPLTDVIIVLVVALLIFGPKRLPMLGRSLGQGMREFKDSITGNSNGEAEERATLTETTAAPAAPASAPTAPEPESADVRTSEHRA